MPLWVTDFSLGPPCPPAGVEGVTWGRFLLKNLLPVTLGNIFAGAVCVATLYSLAFGELGRRVNRALGKAAA